jgi:hypothetical protein
MIQASLFERPSGFPEARVRKRSASAPDMRQLLTLARAIQVCVSEYREDDERLFDF